MFKNWFNGKKIKVELGIYLKSNEIIVLSSNAHNKSFQASKKVSDLDGWGAAIKFLVKEHKLKGYRCQLILASNFYQKYSIDKPQVPAHELNDAIPWALKDIINEPIHELVSDYFDAPNTSNIKPKINIITAKRSLIRSLVAMCKELNLKLNGITTEEMALCNLFDEQSAPCILLSIEPGNELSLLVIHSTKLIFHRRLRGFNQLADINEASPDPLLIDNLSLELQRSLDYLETQLKCTDIEQVFIASPSPVLADICSAIDNALALPVSPFTHQDYQSNYSLTTLGGAKEVTYE